MVVMSQDLHAVATAQHQGPQHWDPGGSAPVGPSAEALGAQQVKQPQHWIPEARRPYGREGRKPTWKPNENDQKPRNLQKLKDPARA